MPGLVRKLVIFAGANEVVLQPLAQRGQRSPAPAIKIAYENNSIRPVLQDEGESGSAEKGFEAFGIVGECVVLRMAGRHPCADSLVFPIGLLTLSKSSFLISITRRQQVAQIQGKPIYAITEVALTPLHSRAAAESAIARTRASLWKRKVDRHVMYDSDTGDDEGELSATASDDVDDDDHHHAPAGDAAALAGSGKGAVEYKRTRSSVAEDVITRKGSYGRFAQKWLSTAGQRRGLGLGMSVSDTAIGKTKHMKEQKVTDTAENLLPKLLRTTQILFGSSRSFFFSYDYDITRSFANRRATNSELPLHTEVDPLFFWNRHLIQPFIDAGQTSLVLPLLQGFVGQLSFEMDSDPPRSIIGPDSAEKSSMEMTDWSAGGGNEDIDDSSDSKDRGDSGGSSTERSFLLTLISRRSVKRTGLRYLRRGVDEEGDAANGVETEQILSDPEWASSSKIHSFVQVRGSVPIFFSQLPYSFKPVPQIQQSEDTNAKAFRRHFQTLSDRYGSIQAVSLVEKHGNEAIVGDYYEKNMEQLNGSGGINDSSIGFEWFDFHAICRGMKFENVSLLMNSLGKKLDSFGHTVEVDGQQLSRQSGVLRTNCMDCLDRTNVVQSACGRRALELQYVYSRNPTVLNQDTFVS